MVALARRITNAPLHTFSVALPAGEDESSVAAESAKRLGTIHHTLRLEQFSVGRCEGRALRCVVLAFREEDLAPMAIGSSKIAHTIKAHSCGATGLDPISTSVRAHHSHCSSRSRTLQDA